jgi:hypothetical protein
VTELEDFLAHHGVKGMKWGVRNRRSARERKARAKRAAIKKRRRTLSDSDIKSYISRLQDERKLKELINEDLKPGRTAVKRIMTESGQKAAKTYATSAYGYALKVAHDKALAPKGTKIRDLIDREDAIARMFPGGPGKKKDKD